MKSPSALKGKMILLGALSLILSAYALYAQVRNSITGRFCKLTHFQRWHDVDHVSHESYFGR